MLKFISGKLAYSDCFCLALRRGNVQKKAFANKLATCRCDNDTAKSDCFLSNGKAYKWIVIIIIDSWG